MTAPRLAPVLVVTPIKELCHPGQQAERHELRIVQVVEFAEQEENPRSGGSAAND